MRFSLNWLRELAAVDATDRDVSRLLTDRGLTVDAVEPDGQDVVLDIDIPANRPDCLGHRGVARELAAACGGRLSGLPRNPGAASDRLGVPVEIADASLCRRFTASIVRGVRVGPSPDWVARRLEACGLRSINNVVDASNLVLLEQGNPIHFYDLATLRGPAIRVRQAREGERLHTLDGIERELAPGMLLIADADRAVGLAGIMGGGATEISERTRDVLIEAAWFDPASIRATSRQLGLQTDASHRFERRVDPQGVVAAQALAVHWLIELAGGTPQDAWADAYPSPFGDRDLELRRGQLRRLLGYSPSPEEADAALTALGLAPRRIDEERIRVRVPSFRADLEREADLVEEVARHLGYDRIPSERAELAIEPRDDPRVALQERARELLAHLGFHEAYGYAMIADGEDTPYVDNDEPRALRIANPLSESMLALRRSLLPGLVRAVSLNQRRGLADVRLFEVEHCFRDRDHSDHSDHPDHPDHEEPLPDEPAHVALAWSGAAAPPHWSAPPRELDLYDVTGVLERLILHLRPAAELERFPARREGFHPSRSTAFRLRARPQELACVGQLHPELQRSLDVPQAIFLATLDLDELACTDARPARFRPLPRVGSVSRDLAVVLPANACFADVLDALTAVDAPVETSIEAIDRYSGPPLDPGSSSLTVRVTLHPLERSLTEPEIEGYRAALVDALRERGLEIRG